MLRIPGKSQWNPGEIREPVSSRSQNFGDLIWTFPRVPQRPRAWLPGILENLSEDSVPNFELSFLYLGVIIPRHTLLLGLHPYPCDFSPFHDHVSLRGKERIVDRFIEIFVSERGDFDFRRNHRLCAIRHGEWGFSGGGPGSGAITPEDQGQLRCPSSFEGIESSFQSGLDDLVDGFDLAIALRVVRCGEIFIDAELVAQVSYSLVVELKGVV